MNLHNILLTYLAFIRISFYIYIIRDITGKYICIIFVDYTWGDNNVILFHIYPS